MIVYELACAHGHSFEGWFPSAAACEEQAARGLIQCPSCASAEVRRLPSAPHVHTTAPAPTRAEEQRLQRVALKALRHLILSNTEDVGRRFPEIARRIHYREEAPRNIRGSVTTQEAEQLREEGVETLTLPAPLLPDEDLH